MRIRTNPQLIIPALHLQDLTPSLVTAALGGVPSYAPREYRRLVEDAVGGIHQLPRLFRHTAGGRFDLKDVVAYFGRSSVGPDEPGRNVYNRFRAAFQDRRDDFGLVFAETTIAASLRFERWGIRLVNYLKSRDGLCISNRTDCCRGSVGSCEPAYLYMTFHFATGRGVARMRSRAEIEIDQGVDEIVEGIEGDVPSTHRSAVRRATALCLGRANQLEWLGPRPVRLVTL